MTQSDDWCGEWQPKQAKPPRAPITADSKPVKGRMLRRKIDRRARDWKWPVFGTVGPAVRSRVKFQMLRLTNEKVGDFEVVADLRGHFEFIDAIRPADLVGRVHFTEGSKSAAYLAEFFALNSPK